MIFGAVCAAGLFAQVRPVEETPGIDFGGYLAFEYIQEGGARFPEGGGFQGLQGGFLVRSPSESRAGFLVEIHGRGEGRFDWKQALARFDVSEALRLKLGLHLVPFGRFNEKARPHENPFIGIPLNLAVLIPENWNDLGAAAEGRWAFLSFAVHIGNGMALDADGVLNRQYADNNADKAWGGRIGVSLSGGMDAGISYASGRSDEAGERRYRMEGLDAAWKTRDWEILGEYVRGRYDLPLPGKTARSEGLFVVLVWMQGGLQPLAGYQAVRTENLAVPSASPFTRRAAYGETADLRSWTVGLRWIPASGLIIKGEYVFNRDNGPVQRRNAVQLQAAAAFMP